MIRTDTLAQAILAAAPGTLAVVGRGPLARVLLGEAALPAGGALVTLPGGEALVGALPGPAHRAAAALETLLGEAPRLFRLPQEAEALLLLRTAPAAAAAAPRGARLRLLLDASGAARAQFLSPAAGDREAGARALLLALSGRAALPLPPLRPGLRLFLECPTEAPDGPVAPGGPPDDPRAPVAVLPLEALARPEALARREAALRRAGWQVGLVGADPEALGWMPPGERWALAPPGAEPPPVLPARLVLLGPRPSWAPPAALHEAAP